MKKTVLIFVAAVLVSASGSFYGGMKYQQSKSPFGSLGGNFQGMSESARQQGFQTGRSGGMLMGEVISKDAESLTLKAKDGSSKIVFFSSSTKVSKTGEGTIDDVLQGDEISVMGQQNSDGSYTAQTIQQGISFPVIQQVNQ